MGRLLGIDYGERRIGLALSDPTQTIASPLTVLLRRNIEDDLAELERVIHDQEVEALVVGVPLNDDGSSNAMTQRVKAFVAKLTTRRPIPVHYVDEAFTSIAAAEALRDHSRDPRKRRALLDKVAAQMILRSYLERPSPLRPTDIAPDEDE